MQGQGAGPSAVAPLPYLGNNSFLVADYGILLLTLNIMSLKEQELEFRRRQIIKVRTSNSIVILKEQVWEIWRRKKINSLSINGSYFHLGMGRYLNLSAKPYGAISVEVPIFVLVKETAYEGKTFVQTQFQEFDSLSILRDKNAVAMGVIIAYMSLLVVKKEILCLDI